MNDKTEETGIIQQTLKEVTQPFKDLIHSPRALWGINISYLLEGLTYFGVVGLLTIFFTEDIGLNDIQSGQMVDFLDGRNYTKYAFFGCNC